MEQRSKFSSTIRKVLPASAAQVDVVEEKVTAMGMRLRDIARRLGNLERLSERKEYRKKRKTLSASLREKAKDLIFGKRTPMQPKKGLMSSLFGSWRSKEQEPAREEIPASKPSLVSPMAESAPQSDMIGAVVSMLKETNLNMEKMDRKLDRVAGMVTTIHERVSPRRLDTPEGPDIQYDPMAPEGVQFQAISDTGKIMRQASKEEARMAKFSIARKMSNRPVDEYVEERANIEESEIFDIEGEDELQVRYEKIQEELEEIKELLEKMKRESADSSFGIFDFLKNGLVGALLAGLGGSALFRMITRRMNIPDSAVDDALKEDAKRAEEEAAKRAGREIGKEGGEKVAKEGIEKAVREKLESAIGKIVAKKVPVAGALVGAGLAGYELSEGDLVGAGLELSSGILGSNPVTAPLALIPDVVSVTRDVAQELNIPEEQVAPIAQEMLKKKLDEAFSGVKGGIPYRKEEPLAEPQSQNKAERIPTMNADELAAVNMATRLGMDPAQMTAFETKRMGSNGVPIVKTINGEAIPRWAYTPEELEMIEKIESNIGEKGSPMMNLEEVPPASLDLKNPTSGMTIQRESSATESATRKSEIADIVTPIIMAPSKTTVVQAGSQGPSAVAISLRHSEPTLATYRASIFDHPVTHPGNYMV